MTAYSLADAVLAALTGRTALVAEQDKTVLAVDEHAVGAQEVVADEHRGVAHV